MLKYAQGIAVLLLVLGVVMYGSYKYGKGVSDTELKLENEYLAKLAKVEAKNAELVIANKKKDEEYFNELFDMQENVDSYVADVRTRTKRLYIKSDEKCLSKDESNTKLPNAERRKELPSDVAERLVRRREKADKLVLKYNACVDYVKSNFAHVNAVQNK